MWVHITVLNHSSQHLKRFLASKKLGSDDEFKDSFEKLFTSMKRALKNLVPH